MATVANNIHIGMARIFIDVTPPATGIPPTLMTHVDGVPTSGTEIGYTKDASTFTYKATKQEIQTEQSLNPVGVFITTEEAMLEFTAMEHVYSALKVAFDSIGSVNDASKTLFYGGDSLGLSDVATRCVVLTSRIRTATTKFEVLTIYKVYNVEGIVMPYQRTTEAVYKVSLKALVSDDRASGDRLFQWYREKTATGVSPSGSKSPSASASASVSPS